MGKIWMPGGGGGADLDVITALSPDVLEGKVTVDKEGDPLPGTMPNLTDRSTIEHASGNSTKVLVGDAAYVSKNTDNVTRVEIRYNGDAGYVKPNTLFAIDQAKMAATLGIEPWKMRGDVNVCGVQGGIPIQSPDVSGTDRVRATNMSNWAGTINLQVRNGHYLNGVNWIQQDIPNYQPGNIKKGVNIGGVVGTFEGYVPTATDLYLRGNNYVTWTTRIQSVITFETGMIRWQGSTTGTPTLSVERNLKGYKYVNVEVQSGNVSSKVNTSVGIGKEAYDYSYGRVFRDDITTLTVVSLDVSAFDATAWITIMAKVSGAGTYMYRIWLS